MICLLAGYGHCFAQNIDIKELQRILEAPTVDQINQLLGPKGYSLRETSTLRWIFRSEMNADASDMTTIYHVTDTIGNKLVYETVNTFFYTNMINQFPGNGFQFKQTITENNNVTLVFSNGKQELLLDVAPVTPSKQYRIILQPVNTLEKPLPRQYNHKVRVHSF